MRIKTHFFGLLILALVPALSVFSDDNVFTMDDINASLQMEYQSQLVLQPRVIKYKAPKKIKKQQLQRKATLPTPAVRQSIVRKSVPDKDELFNAASDGNVKLIARLLQQGVDVNSANNERETPLHMAAANGRYTSVIYLINQGANIHARTIKNWLPIHHATRFRKANIANYLMKKGASPYAKTSDGLSAIDMARTLGDQQLLRILNTK